MEKEAKEKAAREARKTPTNAVRNLSSETTSKYASNLAVTAARLHSHSPTVHR